MNEVHEIVAALKIVLKQKRKTYVDVAKHLMLSEASVKRMFSTHHFTLERVGAICQMLQIGIADLLILVEKQRKTLSFLSYEQEQELVSNKELLLVALCVQNYLNFDDIVTEFNLSNKQCFSLLAILDRIGIIELHPNNRIKLLISQDFRWLNNGPIENFFSRKVQPEFMSHKFQGKHELKLYISGDLSEDSCEKLEKKLYALAREFGERKQKDASLPISERSHVGMMLAFRPWRYSIFDKWRRVKKTK
ncbi:MAG: helix-turn-helix transcriptional regulator [Mariprofundaceae bacterium]|nr:helix-turn-helix transcriptional regulator [Mariprofundaceae bacterium]